MVVSTHTAPSEIREGLFFLESHIAYSSQRESGSPTKNRSVLALLRAVPSGRREISAGSSV